MAAISGLVQLLNRREQDELREYHERNQTSAQASVGSLADKLRGALKQS